MDNSSRYPAGYLADCRAFLDAAAQHDPAELPRRRPEAPAPRLRSAAGRARIAASFAVVLVASLGPMVGLVVRLWP